MALLVFVAMGFNDGTIGFTDDGVRVADDVYQLWILGGEPEGDAEFQEWRYTLRIFRYTSGVLCGQLLALLVGVALARRYGQVAALKRAVPLALVLAGVAVAVAYPLAHVRETGLYFTGNDSRFPAGPFHDPVLVRVLLCQLAAYPLYAATGVGFGSLLGRGGIARVVRWLLVPGLLVGWSVATLTGVMQNDRFDGPGWLLWTVPPVAAGAALALAGTSVDVFPEPAVVVGDWGRGASIALLVSAAGFALVFNLLAHLDSRRRQEVHALDPPP
jgi:hypothetical protein